MLLIKQIQSMEGNVFEAAGINGSGVRIAIFDGGFPDVDTHPAFEHIRNEGRIKGTYDFVRKKDFVYSYNSHGTMVMSNIGGMYKGKPMGLATGAEFLLARTEKNTEPFSEEVNWAAALEWADKNGAHIVNSSLGYTYHRYFPYEMDGQTAFVSRMANTATSKGILVINAAGNDGDNSWTVIGAPADADSILTVGGINPDTDYKISFSSVGPTSDFRRKPNVVAYGKTVVASTKDKTTIAFGTSFASPLVAGFAACAKQLHPTLNGIELKEFIEQSGMLYPYFDYSHGHGIPVASKAMNKDSNSIEANFIFKDTGNNYKVKINDNQKITKAKNPAKTYNNYFYFAYINDQNIICEWGIIIVTENSFNIQKPLKCENIKQLQMHFRGYTFTFNFS
jgi:serine protease AprX